MVKLSRNIEGDEDEDKIEEKGGSYADDVYGIKFSPS